MQYTLLSETIETFSGFDILKRIYKSEELSDLDAKRMSYADAFLYKSSMINENTVDVIDIIQSTFPTKHTISPEYHEIEITHDTVNNSIKVLIIFKLIKSYEQ